MIPLKVSYIGDPFERAAGKPMTNPAITAFGRAFRGPYFDQPADVVDISDLPVEHQRKIALNNHFKVIEGDVPAAPKLAKADIAPVVVTLSPDDFKRLSGAAEELSAPPKKAASKKAASAEE